MSDPDVEREEAANEARAAEGEKAEGENGVLDAIGDVFSFLHDEDVDPEDPAAIERRRRANDEAARE